MVGENRSLDFPKLPAAGKDVWHRGNNVPKTTRPADRIEDVLRQGATTTPKENAPITGKTLAYDLAAIAVRFQISRGAMTRTDLADLTKIPTDQNYARGELEVRERLRKGDFAAFSKLEETEAEAIWREVRRLSKECALISDTTVGGVELANRLVKEFLQRCLEKIVVAAKERGSLKAIWQKNIQQRTKDAIMEALDDFHYGPRTAPGPRTASSCDVPEAAQRTSRYVKAQLSQNRPTEAMSREEEFHLKNAVLFLYAIIKKKTGADTPQPRDVRGCLDDGNFMSEAFKDIVRAGVPLSADTFRNQIAMRLWEETTKKYRTHAA